MTETEKRYPIELPLGEATATLRPFDAGDQEAMLRFARSLPAHDLLFLRRDIADPREVKAWIADIESGLVTTLIAWLGDDIVGYVTLHRNDLRWSRHVAELRVLVSDAVRGRKLGRILTQEAFRLALAEGIEKIVARMTPDQKGAIAVFEGLGFRAEALLKDHVRDGEGNLHDLLVMSHPVSEFHSMLEAYGVPEGLGAGGTGALPS